MAQKTNIILAFFLPRLQDIVFITIFVGALLTGQRMVNTDSDLGRDLALGNYILDVHHIPTHDLLSFTKEGQPRPPYEWLAQVLFAAAYRLLNLDGTVLLTALVIAAVFVLVYVDSARRSGLPFIALLLTIWAAAASSLHWLTRPHIFSFVFFALWIKELDCVRKDENIPLWRFPALMLIWANIHGGFVFGILAWTAYMFGWLWDFRRNSASRKLAGKLLFIGGTSLIATILTPDLWHNWEAVLNNRSSYILNRTVETMPPNLALPGVWPFLGLLSLALVLLILNAKKATAPHVFLLTGLTLMSLLMARNIPFFAIAAAPILAEWAKQTLGRFDYWLRFEQGLSFIDGGLRGLLWPVLITAMAIGLLAYHYARTQTSIIKFSPQIFPVQAADWLMDHPLEGNMFNDFNWGGYLLYRLWPGQRVFIDSQSDFYGETFVRQYEQIMTAQDGWQELLSQYNVKWAIIPNKSLLAEALTLDPNWQIDYKDQAAIILSHK